jgi:hypothetical protein
MLGCYVLEPQRHRAHRDKEQLSTKLETGLAALAMSGAAAVADQLYTQFRTRLERLESANVVLIYDEQQYLQLTGIREGRSVGSRHHFRKIPICILDSSTV